MVGVRIRLKTIGEVAAGAVIRALKVTVEVGVMMHYFTTLNKTNKYFES